MPDDCEVAVIGGGVSGLATAFFLQQSGIRCTLFEKSQQLGGLIRTDTIQGCQLEAGPDSYIATKPAVTELAGQLHGLKDEIIRSNDERRRIYIVRNGQPIEMPVGMSMMVPGNMNAALKSRLFSSSTKLGFFAELFFPPRFRINDISVQDFVISHFGQEMLEYVTEPLLSGVYGGDSAQLSANAVLPRFVAYEREYGSLIRGVRRERRKAASSVLGSLFLSFQRGMQSLTDALFNAIDGKVRILHQELAKLKPGASGWRLGCAGCEFKARDVILALPAYTAAGLLGNAAPQLASELWQIPYSSAILVTVVYRKDEAPVPEGFGFLTPRRERQTIAATTFVGTKWPSRIPPELVALRAFIVDPEAPKLLALSDDELLELVRADFARLLGVGASPLFSTVHRRANSMPQYVIGHEARRKRIWSLLSEFPGLYLTGNAYDGVGVPDCVRLAKQTANLIAQGTRAKPTTRPGW